jgi:hypothetical protein
MGERAVDADLLNLLRQWVDDPDVKYYLVVIGKRVEVLHRPRACQRSAQPGPAWRAYHGSSDYGSAEATVTSGSRQQK